MTEDHTDSAEKHERVRFRREEIVDLSALPSSIGVAVEPAMPRRRPIFAPAAKSLAAAIVLVSLLYIGLAYVSNSGLGADRLKIEAEAALRRSLGYDVDVTIGAAKFSLLGPGLLNLDLSSVSLGVPKAERPTISAADIRLGLRPLSLLFGKLEVASADVSGARIVGQAISAGDGRAPLAAMVNEAGLIDPDLALTAIFDGVQSIGDGLSGNGAPNLRVTDVRFSLPRGLPFDEITVDSASLRHSTAGIQLDGKARFDGRAAEFSGLIEASAASRRADRFNIRLSSPNQTDAPKSLSFGPLNMSVAGDRTPGGDAARVTATFDADALSVDLGTRGRLDGKMEMSATLAAGSGKIEIEQLNAVIGRSTYRMTGAIGPKPVVGDQTREPAYRFEFVSEEASIAPQDSSEPAMAMAMRLAGDFHPDNRTASIDRIDIKSQTGTAFGNASVTLTDSGPPGLALALDVKGMSVQHVKQLWPWFAAESARRWVYTNLFGGAVSEGSIRFAVAPGRLGNGQRLNESEVSGRFAINATRFDTAGLLPPIRDADGVVSFAGDDVDISLDRGTVYVVSGEAVNADRGRLVIKDAGVRPVIGALEIDVSGGASAVAELASLEPINVMAATGIAPASLSGDVSGKIRARIPMQKGIDRSLLSWDVKLDYRDLSVAKPIQGQTITSADGSIVVDTSKAIIKGKALFNGIPATLDFIEPLRNSSVVRQRKLELGLDGRGLRRIAPGLQGVVDGQVRVSVDASNAEGQMFEADLTNATLSLPVVGWSKGEGIPASLTFELDRDGTTSKLSNLELSGKTFGLTGGVTLENGSLATASFDKVRLNRDDAIAVTVKKSGKGYAVSVEGDAFDARGLIKQAMAPAKAGARPAIAISMKARVARIPGFNGEALRGAEISYAGTGRSATFDLNAQTEKGSAVNIMKGNSDGVPTIRVETQNAGSFLRFLDVYDRIQGGTLALKMQERSGGIYVGSLDARDFWVVDEAKLGSIVSASPAAGGRSLGDSAQNRIDTSRVKFDRGFANIEKGPSYLRVDKGVLRGPSIGTTFQGTVYDENNRIQVTGTFMPAYGLNRIFGDLPLVGALLGNGNDKGLIGVTYKLTGNVKAPQLQINPLSVIAPGIFRTIFEFQ